MFAIATIIKYPDGTHEFRNGSIVRLPPELHSSTRVSQYLKVTRAGWSTGEFGYSIFAKQGISGELFLFPGLIVVGGSKITRRFTGYSTSFQRSQIEEFADGIVAYAEKLKIHSQNDFNILVHDLRSISNSIYNAAEEAKRYCSIGENVETQIRIQNVIAFQTILKMRTDALDFLGNAHPLTEDGEISVFRKVDKVCRSFKPKATAQNQYIELLGSSYETTWGPELLEIVPYTIIDNAIKYAPPNSTISVAVTDGSDICLRVASLGPFIRPDEYGRIFSRGYRGVAAIASGVPGSGIGLHIVEKIVRTCYGGSLSVEQGSSPKTSDGTFLFETEFVVNFPISRRGKR